MTYIDTISSTGLNVTFGSEPVNLLVEGVYVHHGKKEIKGYVDDHIKPLLDTIIKEKSVDLDQSVQAFNQNVYQKTTDFNQHLEEQKNYITEQAELFATASIEMNPEGSAKYWAEQAKINYEEALALADEINNEEV